MNKKPKYTDLQCAAAAESYYNEYRSKQIQSGFELFIATDGENCMFVSPSYQPDEDDVDLRIFRCEVRRGADGRSTTAGSGLTLVWPRTEEAEDQLWRSFERFCATPPYYKKNGIVYHNGKAQMPVDHAWLRAIIREEITNNSSLLTPNS